jgi:16S rRNA processing protein RimM
VEDAARQSSPKEQWGSGATGVPEPRFLAVGQVAGAHGIRGEIKVNILTDDPERFGRLSRVWLGRDEEEPVPWPLEGYRLHHGRALLKLEGCDNRTLAESLRAHLVLVPLEEAIPLEEDEYYEHQIIGLGVWTSSGERLGEIEEILYTGANEVYIVRSDEPGRKEILIPAIEEVVLEIDLEAGRMTIEPLAGLF